MTLDNNILKTFKHSIEEKVKFHEVDMMSICNNAVYFNYFEDARIKYIQDLKANYKLKQLLENGSFFIMAHNECDYFIPAIFDDELLVYTKINFIKNTSFGFQHLVARKSDNQILASGGGILVHINFQTKQKIKLPQEFYDAVLNYEGDVNINRE